MSAIIENKDVILEDKKNDKGLTIKELGYLLQMVDNSSHEGNVLELALSIKYKLQKRINSLMQNKEMI